MERETFASWEIEHAQQQTNEEWLAKLSKRKYLTKGQWFHGFGRRVTVPFEEARQNRTTMGGRTLYLFSEDQTEPIE